MGKVYTDLVEKYSYLIGEKINKWTVLDIVMIEKGGRNRPHAICECECGTIKPVWVINLINDRSKDCGCGRKTILRETRTKNLVGQKFGKLTVVELLEDSNKFNRRMYRCKCDCGNEIITSSICLMGGHTNSCGCLVSYWNMYIKKFLDKNNIENQPEYPVVIDDVRYKYDFYLPQYNLFIEYDGQQHYELVRYYGSNIEENKCILKKVQEHDKIKNKYCKDNNINLLRIPYWETKNIETIINNHLQRLSEKGLAV